MKPKLYTFHVRKSFTSRRGRGTPSFPICVGILSTIKVRNLLKSAMSFGQFASSSQFYLYGKSHCTRTGWEKHILSYDQPDILKDPALNLSGKVFMITGANAGIGR